MSYNARDLLSNLLKKDPEERFTAAKALNHVWFKEEDRSDHLIKSLTKKIAQLRDF